MNKFLKDGICPEKNLEVDKNDEPSQEFVHIPNVEKAIIDLNKITGEKPSSNTEETWKQLPNQVSVDDLKTSNTITQPRTNRNSNPPKKKAKQLRIEKKKAKLDVLGKNWEPKQRTSTEKTIRDYINDVDESNCHKLKVIFNI